MVINIYQIKELNVNEKAREWCKLSYPGHPKGCPNYGKQERCPPKAPLIDEFIDIDKPCWFIVSDFNLGEFERKMKEKHSNWSRRQARCCLYWQGGVRKKVKEKATEFAEENNLIYTMCPEAMGVHVITTARKLGIPVKVKPEDMVYVIALAGYEKGELK